MISRPIPPKTESAIEEGSGTVATISAAKLASGGAALFVMSAQLVPLFCQ